ncbi:MAG: glycosyltransferase [Deltaproteobacteria bacterium]|nr:glycosyltransferase [Deltaproteobacteria bacterium]
MTSPRVSVIIPAYNSLATVTSTLAHLDSQKEDIHEIVLVDSSPPTQQTELAEVIKQYPLVKAVFLKEKTIPAIGRNIGAKVATGDLFLFIDSDAFPDAKWVKTIVAQYLKGRRLGGGAIALPDFQMRNILAIAQYFLQFNEFIPTGDDRQKKFAPSCNLFCARDIFEDVGGFPEVRASEDVLFGLKASLNYDFWFLPGSKVYHIFGDSWQRFRSNQFLLGKYVAVYKKEDTKDSLKKALFHPAVQACSLPLVPVYKYALLARRIMGADLKNIAMFLGVSPAVALGLLIWSVGFFKGATTPSNR